MPASSIAGHGASNSRAFDFANLASEAIAGDRGLQDQPRQHADRRHRRDDQHQDRASARQSGPAHQPRRQGRDRHLRRTTCRVTCRATDHAGDLRHLQQHVRRRQIRHRAQRQLPGARLRLQPGRGRQRLAPVRAATRTTGARSRSPVRPARRTSPTVPIATDIYSVPQNLSYSVNGIERKRTNGQLALQLRRSMRSPRRSTTPTPRTRSSSSATSCRCGSTSVRRPAPGPTVRSPARCLHRDRFRPANSDLSMGGAKFATKNENKSLGFNVDWEVSRPLRPAARLPRLERRVRRRQPVRLERGARRRRLLPRHHHGRLQQDFPVLSVRLPAGMTGIDAVADAGHRLELPQQLHEVGDRAGAAERPLRLRRARAWTSASR